MLRIRERAIFAFCATLISSTSALAGMWTEVGDAPNGVPGHQETIGDGSLDAVTGRLNRAGGDHVDTYCILVTDPSTFLASTKINFGGSAVVTTGGNADTRLWLWSSSGAILLGNDDINNIGGTDTFASLISDPSTFAGLTLNETVNPTAAAISLVSGTKYLLSISEFSNDPVNAVNVLLANLDSDFDALHGPNPAAVGGFDHWENPADPTVFDYTIALRGASFCRVPEPTVAALGSLALLACGAAGVRRWRKGRSALAISCYS